MAKFKYVLPILAVTIAIAAVFAFKAKPAINIHSKFAPVVWQYNGPQPGSSTDWLDESNYSFLANSTLEPGICEGTEELCAIVAEERIDIIEGIPTESGEPNITSPLATQIVGEMGGTDYSSVFQKDN